MQILIKDILQDPQTCLETSASVPRFSRYGKKKCLRAVNTPPPCPIPACTSLQSLPRVHPVTAPLPSCLWHLQKQAPGTCPWMLWGLFLPLPAAHLSCALGHMESRVLEQPRHRHRHQLPAGHGAPSSTQPGTTATQPRTSCCGYNMFIACLHRT